jgi:hypothetical protein
MNILFFLTAHFIACNSKEDTADTGTANNEETENTENTETETGTEGETETETGEEETNNELLGLWVDENPLLSDACGVEEGLDRPLEIVVNKVLENSIEIEVPSEEQEGQFPELDCELLEGNTFNCPELLFFQLHISELNPDAPADLDAELSYTINLNGNFTEQPTMDGILVSGLDCSGSDCNGVAAELGTEFPCGMETVFSATQQEIE